MTLYDEHLLADVTLATELANHEAHLESVKHEIELELQRTLEAVKQIIEEDIQKTRAALLALNLPASHSYRRNNKGFSEAASKQGMTLKTGGRGRDRKPRKKRASRPKKTARSHPST